jgi:hypothetical protein
LNKKTKTKSKATAPGCLDDEEDGHDEWAVKTTEKQTTTIFCLPWLDSRRISMGESR